MFLVIVSMWTLLVGGFAAFGAQLFERRKWEKRLLQLSGALRPGDADTDAARMERLERAVDTIAVELERVGEGQRFVTKLLADREARVAARSPKPGEVPVARPPAT